MSYSHSTHSTKDRKLLIDYFGISVHCSNTTSVRLLHAILSKDARKVKDAIHVEAASDVNDLCRCWTKHQDAPSISYTLTPLSLAVRFSTNRVVRALLRRGADPNVKCDMTPLGVAVRRNNHRLVALLLDSGADINLLTHPVAKWKSSNDDEEDGDHLMQTPLHIACRKGFVAITSYLLLRRAATDIVDGSGNTSVNVARQYGHREVEVLILRDVACKTSMSVRPALCADDDVPIVTRYERTSTTQLIVSCIHNDMTKARCLIAYGANVNATDASQNTALHYACANGNQKLVKLLLRNDAKDDVLNEEKQSPIQVALKYGYLATAFVLIEHNNCVLPRKLLFATNSEGNTLLHIACKQNRVSVVKQLIKQGALFNVANRKGKLPLQSASAEMRRIVRDCILQRARIRITDSYFHLIYGMCDYDLKMSLARCCSRPCEANFSFLLHIICCNIFTKFTEDVQRETLQQLINLGADVNAVDCHGNTPLHISCCCVPDRLSVINTLLYNGASPYIVNGDGKTALWNAFSKNYGTLVRWLIWTKKIVVDAEVLHGFNVNENTLLRMLAIDKAIIDKLLWKLVEQSARINVFPPATFAYSHNASASGNKQPNLLNVLARNNNWSLIRKLVEVGCCDFTTEIFRLLFEHPMWLDSNEPSLRARAEMSKWFRLAGFGQSNEFNAHNENFLQEFYIREFRAQLNSEYHSEVSAIFFDNAYDTEHDVSRPRWASTTTDEKTMVTLKWLQHDMENPSSLSRLCVYTIRHELIYADPDGRSIYSSIDKLPLPTRLKDSLKLKDIECDAECLNQQPSHSAHINTAVPRILYYRCDEFLFSVSPVCMNSIFISAMFNNVDADCTWLMSDAEEQLVEGTNSYTQRRPQKPNCTQKKFVGKPTVRHSVRRSRTLAQPRRHQ